MICGKCEQQYRPTAAQIYEMYCPHTVNRAPSMYSPMVFDGRDDSLPFTHNTKTKLRKLLTELVSTWADQEGMSKRQMRKIAEDFFKIGRAYGAKKGIYESEAGELEIVEVEEKISLRKDKDVKELAKRLEKL